MEIDELEKLAKAATPGHYLAHRGCSPDISNFVKVDNNYLTEDDAIYLATANPQTILKLIAVVRASKFVSENYYQFGTSDSNFVVWQSELAEALADLEKE